MANNKILNTIYMQVYDEQGNLNEEQTWCEDKIFSTDIEYKRVK